MTMTISAFFSVSWLIRFVFVMGVRTIILQGLQNSMVAITVQTAKQ